MITGDFNSIHSAWGNNYSCANGEKLMTGIQSNNFVLLNDGNPTYRPHWRESSSSLDLTIVNSDLLSDSEWKTELDNWGSDHAPIYIFGKYKV